MRLLLLGTVVVVVMSGLSCGGGGSDSSSGAAAVLAMTEETYTIESAPGVSLRLYRLKPGGTVFPKPVLLTHGYGVHSGVFDVEPSHSLARHLVEKGFEVWMADTRGSGESSPESLTDLPAWHFSFDDMVHVDMPVVIDFMLQKSGAAQFHWIGHSFGGPIILAYLGTHPGTPCAGAVMFAPAVFVPYFGWQVDSKRQTFWAVVSAMRWAIPTGLPLPQGSLAQGAALVIPEPAYTWTVWMLTSFTGPLILSKANMSPEIVSLAMKKAVADVPSTGMRQMAQWGTYMDTFTYGPSPYEWHYESSAYRQANGFQSYSAMLPDLKVPQLWISGAADFLVPSGMVKQAYWLSGAKDKAYVDAGKASGFSADYGHGDILIGNKAPEEIYPIISGWLAARGD